MRGNIVEVFARAHPERLGLLGLASGRDALPLLLECYEAALHAAHPGTQSRDLARQMRSVAADNVAAMLEPAAGQPQHRLAQRRRHQIARRPEAGDDIDLDRRPVAASARRESCRRCLR